MTISFHKYCSRILATLFLLQLSFVSFSQRCNHANQIQSLYSQLVKQGFDTKQPISYHYFFIDQNEQELARFKDLLLKQSYRYVGTVRSAGKFQLEVERTDAFDANSATKMEKSMSELAKANNIDTFDGFELKSEENVDSKTDFRQEVERISTTELFKKGLEFYDKQDDEKALVVFDRCIKLGIDSETSYYKRANCKTALGQTTEAIVDLGNVLRLNPKHYEANFNLGGLYFDNANFEKALNYYQKAVELNPKSDNGFYRLAATYQKIGMKNAALQNCQKSLQLNPNNQYAKALLSSLK
jgi:tetratricopeptide (TPR) repeat protein